MNYQEKVEELEKIVARMENEDLPLEEAVKLFEQGVQLIKDCKTYLEEIKGTVTKVKLNVNAYTEEPMKPTGK